MSNIPVFKIFVPLKESIYFPCSISNGTPVAKELSMSSAIATASLFSIAN